MDRNIIFLGLHGRFPGSDNKTSLLTPTRFEAFRMALIIRKFLAAGAKSHEELDSLSGKFSFSQTSAFGRFGRAMMQPLYRKLYAPYYNPVVSASGQMFLEWRAAALPRIRPRSTIAH